MSPESSTCGSTLLLGLPDDVFSVVTRSLPPSDLCNLGLSCKCLHTLLASDKVWFTQCENLGVVPPRELLEWRHAVSSYKAVCRFLYSIRPLLGIWVHQNPELGNVVYVMPGFMSVVGCRIIPQELGPLGIEDGPILWAPVFEVLGDSDGCSTFFLHGREKGTDYVYPGSVKSVDRACNVMLLEVEPRVRKNEARLLLSRSLDIEVSRKVCRSNTGLSRSFRVCGPGQTVVPFSRLAFSDRRKLLEIMTNHVRLKVSDPATGLMFPSIGACGENLGKEMVACNNRRLVILSALKLSGGHVELESSPSDPTQLEVSEIKKNLEQSAGLHYSINEDEGRTNANGSNKRKTLGKYFRDSINQLLGKSTGSNLGGTSRNGCSSSSSSSSKHVQLHEFLNSGDTIGLALHASTVKLSSYRAWPNMHDSRFALYKLPLRSANPEQEYAGLWGGTFGWPPGKPTEDKPGKALFFLLLSYEESEGNKLLIATKILEGTHYVLHPNGSAMFMVNIDEPSSDSFPWDYSDVDSSPVSVRQAFVGEGIANGYGFRYPGSKPGSLFMFGNGNLAFIWKESRAVLTLQRLNLQELLRKGEKVPALPPIANFSYLTKSYSNVFAGFPNSSNSLSSPRQRR